MKQRETCPKCKHNCITGGPVEIDGDKATQPVHCDHCGYCWVDVYRLVAREE